MNKENKRRILNFFGITSVLIGCYIFIFMGTAIWLYTLGVCLFLGGALLINTSRRLTSDKPITTVHTSEKGSIPECKKALIKSWIGAFVMLAALLLVVSLANTDWWDVAVFFALICGIIGAILLASYLQCVKRINERQ